MRDLSVNGITLPGDQHVCQDLWGQASSVLWVIDGATRANSQANDETVRWVTNFSDALAKQISNAPDADLGNVLSAAITKVAIKETFEHPSATIAMARYTNQGIETLVLGDCAILVETSDGEITAITDTRLQNVAPELRRARRDARATGNKSLFDELTAKLLQQEDYWRNHDNGFWVVQNNPEATKEALHNVFQGARQALLMSDGVFNAIQKFSSSRDAAFKSLISSPAKYSNALKTAVAEHEDHCDDMTVVAGIWTV